MEKQRGIAVLDFGGQYAHLIARRVREAGAYSEILPPESTVDELRHAAGIILSGGPQSVYDAESPQADKRIFELGVPVLGICYGHQWLAHALGGTVTSGSTKEYGHTQINVVNEGTLFKNLPPRFTVWMSHGDEVSVLPDGFVTAASSEDCANAAMANAEKNIFGVQFHLEVVHSEHGADIMLKFIELCDADPWSIESYASHVGDALRTEVGDKKVFMLVSGGVDSTVAFTLLNRVLGEGRVQGLLIDTGLMRKDEVKNIRTAFGELGITNLRIEDASDEFFTALEGVHDPEEKRKRIGEAFLAVQKRVSDTMNLTPEAGWMLGQGTIYPDTIETGGTKHAAHIKTHHNRIDAIQELIKRGLVVEPLKELYKDEVRALGEELGLPHDLVQRHPFPGPGLGVRILCASDEGRTDVPAEETLIPAPHVVLPIQSVGVQGDGRTYRHAVSLFAKDPSAVSDEFRSLATSIPNKFPAFNRVLQCVSHAEPVPLRVTPSAITRERADLLREADAIVDDEVRRADLYAAIWQFPVVLLPVGIREGGQSVVLRPVESQEAMTAKAAPLPPDVLKRMADRIMGLPGIDAVFLDLTNKPPGTIEWE